MRKQCIALLTVMVAGFILQSIPARSAQSLLVTKVNQAPDINGKGNDQIWKSAETINIKDRTADVDVAIKAVYSKDMIFFLVRYPDPGEDRLHKPWVWDKEMEAYLLGSQREDTFTFKWNMGGNELDISNFSDDDYIADVWYWKAHRTDPAGYSDDKLHVLASEAGKKAKKIISKTGKTRYLMRLGDSGTPAQKKRILTSYQGDVLPQYESRKPDGSRADVLARGIWEKGYWTIEFGRKLKTGHSDDLQFDPQDNRKYQFGISIAGLYGEQIDKTKPHWYGQGRISETLYLTFR